MAEKILVVDDDIETLRLVGLMLQRQGYQIVAASNGQQALQMAKAEKPDLVLLDVMMPDMDGYEVTRHLRADAVTSSVPIIMFTAKSQVDDKVTGFEAGADDYLTKPTQPRELFAHVKAVLARGGKMRPTTVEAMPGGEKGYVVGILGAKAGLGASTLALNLAISLYTRIQKDVCVAELRPGEGSLGLDLGYNRPEGLLRLLEKKPKEITAVDVQNALLMHSSSGVRLLLASYQPTDVQYVTASESFEVITQHLTRMGAFVLLDMGPGLSPTHDKVLPYCDEVIVILEPVPSTIIRTRALLDELSGKGFGEGRVTVVLYTRNRLELQLSLAQVQESIKGNIAMVFTPAPELSFQAAKSNTPLVILHPDNLTSQQFSKLAEVITKHVHNK
jgi:CheY-like chemotaxis protein